MTRKNIYKVKGVAKLDSLTLMKLHALPGNNSKPGGTEVIHLQYSCMEV